MGLISRVSSRTYRAMPTAPTSLQKWKTKKRPPKSSKNSFQNFRKDKRAKKRTFESTEISKLETKIRRLDADSLGQLNKNATFEKFPISEGLQGSMKSCGFVKPTRIQERTLPFTLKGDDVIAAARTGSGKTLAFVVPILEDLYRQQWSEVQSVGALVLAPTRELANQIQIVFKRLIEGSKSHILSASAITGGSDMQLEAALIARNQILIATPGRLNKHLEQTPGFSLESCRTLVLDEADRMLDMGFREEITQILEYLPNDRQTMLFSATGKGYSLSQFKTLTKNKKTKRQLHIITDELEETGLQEQITSQPDKLKQIFMAVKAEQKLNFLYNFLKTKQKQKILVFVSTCKQVGYLHEILQIVQPGTLKVLKLRGSDSHEKRIQNYQEFLRKQTGVLIATDIAARGLDVSKTRLDEKRFSGNQAGNKAIDWVLQLDAADSVETYIHRAGRTARAGSKGRSLSIFLPEEIEQGALEKFSKFKIPIVEKRPDLAKFTPIEKTLQNVCAKDKGLHEVGKRAFGSYFDYLVFAKNDKNERLCLKPEFVRKLKLDEFAQSYGLRTCPELRHFKKSKKAPTPQTEAKAFAASDESDSDDDMFTKKSVEIPALPESSKISKSSKPVTKEKQLKAELGTTENKKVKFESSDDEAEEAPESSSKNVHQIDIDAEKSKLVEGDLLDKKSYKERRKERKRLAKMKKKQERLARMGDEVDSDDEGTERVEMEEALDTANLEDLEKMAASML